MKSYWVCVLKQYIGWNYGLNAIAFSHDAPLLMVLPMVHMRSLQDKFYALLVFKLGYIGTVNAEVNAKACKPNKIVYTWTFHELLENKTFSLNRLEACIFTWNRIMHGKTKSFLSQYLLCARYKNFGKYCEDISFRLSASSILTTKSACSFHVLWSVVPGIISTYWNHWFKGSNILTFSLKNVYEFKNSSSVIPPKSFGKPDAMIKWDYLKNAIGEGYEHFSNHSTEVMVMGLTFMCQEQFLWFQLFHR